MARSARRGRKIMKKEMGGKQSVRRRIGVAINVVCVIITALMLYVVISYNADNTLFGGTYYVEDGNVGSESYDVIKTSSVDAAALSIGDKVAFLMDVNADNEREVVTREVYSVSTEADGKTVIRTAEEGSDNPDGWYVTDKSLLGRVESVGTTGGKLLTFLKNDNFLVAVIVIVILLSAYEIGMLFVINRLNYRKDNNRDESPVWEEGEKQYIGKINNQAIAIYPKRSERGKVIYDTVPYSDGH